MVGSMVEINLDDPVALERKGEASFFIAMIGGPIFAADVMKRPAQLFPVLWNESSETSRLYLSRFIPTPPGLAWRLSPSWECMAVDMRNLILLRMERLIAVALGVLVNE